MTDENQEEQQARTGSDLLLRLAGWSAYVSGVVSVFGIIFLFLFFGGAGEKYGPMNDVAAIIQYVLMLPIALALQRLLQPYGAERSRAVMRLGIAGMTAVILLQTLLVVGVLPFGIQIILVIPAFLVVLAWLVRNRNLGLSANIVPESMPLTVLAGLYVGYPFWAFKVGRRLLKR